MRTSAELVALYEDAVAGVDPADRRPFEEWAARFSASNRVEEEAVREIREANRAALHAVTVKHVRRKQRNDSIAAGMRAVRACRVRRAPRPRATRRVRRLIRRSARSPGREPEPEPPLAAERPA